MQYKHHPEPEYYEEWDESWEEDWSEAESELRADYTPAKSAGREFDDVAGYYRFGWGARRKRRSTKDWRSIEPEIRKDWEENQAEEGRSWDDAREHIRRGWEKGKRQE